MSYKCQPASSLAENISVFSADSESSSFMFHFTGVNICACTANARNVSISKVTSFFIYILYYFTSFYLSTI